MQKNKLKQAVMHAVIAFTMAGTTLSPIIAQPVPVCASDLTVTEAQSPIISKRKLTLCVGQKEMLRASLPNKKSVAQWSSSNKKVATVSSVGEVKAVGTGTATITATLDSTSPVTVSCKVTVTSSKVTKITVKANTSQFYLGLNDEQPIIMKATVSPATAANKAVTWSSSNPKVATIDSKGRVHTKKPGTTTITATAKDGSGVKGTKKITVVLGGNQEIGIAHIAPKAQANIKQAAKALNVIGWWNCTDGTLPEDFCSGEFDSDNWVIPVLQAGSTISYNEVGHFLSFIAGYAANSAAFRKIYAEEAKNYIFGSPDSPEEFFADVYADVTMGLNIKVIVPKACNYVQSCINKITPQRINSLKSIYKR